MQDPRYKHKYFDNIDQVAPDNDGNESDNHLDAHNCRNSCLKFLAYLSQN